MRRNYQLRFIPALVTREHEDALLLTGLGDKTVRLKRQGAALSALLANLAAGGLTADQLCDVAIKADPVNADIARIYYLLAIFEKNGFLGYTVSAKGKSLATLEPASFSFRLTDSTNSEELLQLSRFVCLRREGDVMVAESPLGHGRVIFHDPLLCALPGLLAMPQRSGDLATALPMFAPAVLEAVLELLKNAGVISPCGSDLRLAEESDTALRQWEFHDLFFHTRSRPGRSLGPHGATFRFKADLQHAPAFKPSMSTQRVALDRPAPTGDGPDFYKVLEARRSLRGRGDLPLTIEQLGEFLWRSARVQTVYAGELTETLGYQASLRPHPSGGGIHELEVYLFVSRCAGLSPGLFRYSPLAHELEFIADLGPKQQLLVTNAMNATGIGHPPDVLLTLAARFGRAAWKYEGLAYALLQKNVGALYQQMYLVATALGLAPCALGGGNSDMFAEATGLDYFAETSVGEFILSSAAA
jgi:SagB-type dehydrogenase family enzyme